MGTVSMDVHEYDKVISELTFAGQAIGRWAFGRCAPLTYVVGVCVGVHTDLLLAVGLIATRHSSTIIAGWSCQHKQ